MNNNFLNPNYPITLEELCKIDGTSYLYFVFDKNINITIELYNRFICCNNSNYDILKNVIDGFLRNPTLTLDDINNLQLPRHLSKYMSKVLWTSISVNLNIPWSYILQKKDVNWSWVALSRRLDLSFETVINNKDLPWFWNSVSKNRCIKLSNVIDNPELPWDFRGLSENPNLDIDFVIKNIDKKWDWRFVSSNEGITISDISKYPELPWIYRWVQFNPNLTSEFVKANMDKQWDWNFMRINYLAGIKKSKQERSSHNYLDYEKIPLEYILENPDLPWSWRYVSCHPDLNPDIIKKYDSLPWNYSEIDKNPIMYPVTYNSFKYLDNSYLKKEYYKFVKGNLDPYLCDDLIHLVSGFI